ncbi:MAG: DUF3298 domain-containing protein [Stellaceae bacterium]
MTAGIGPLFAASLAALLALGSGAQAASFDCTKPANARETIVCADRALAAADEAVAAELSAALAPLSPPARQALQDAQRAWLRFVDTLCGTAGPAIPAAVGEREAPAACLQRRYGVRKRQLEQATVASGGFVIGREERFAATPSRDRLGFAERDIAGPQIDRPKNAAERAWNAAVRRRIDAVARPEERLDEDCYVDYRIASVGPRLISTVITDYRYPHGAAHGGEAVSGFNWLLEPRRDLAAADLFAPGKAWQNALAQRAFAQLQRQIEPAMLFAKRASALRESVSKPENWAIEPKGLGILFQQYEVGPYVIGHPEAILAWPALRPLFAARPAFAIPPR